MFSAPSFGTPETTPSKSEEIPPSCFLIIFISLNQLVQQRTEDLAGLISACNRDSGVDWATGLFEEVPLTQPDGRLFFVIVTYL